MTTNDDPEAGFRDNISVFGNDKEVEGDMDQPPPSQRETAEQRLERFSKMPGVVVHRNPNPIPWEPPTDIWVNEGVTVRDILGRDDDEEDID